jgi:hypothetical protein
MAYKIVSACFRCFYIQEEDTVKSYHDGLSLRPTGLAGVPRLQVGKSLPTCSQPTIHCRFGGLRQDHSPGRRVRDVSTLVDGLGAMELGEAQRV